MALFIQIISLFFAIKFTSINLSKALVKDETPSWNFSIMATAWTAFIAVTWLIK